MIKQYVVGGAVRDILLGTKPNDIDYVWVGATPKYLQEKGFQWLHEASFPVFLDGDGNEHALARKEKKVGQGYKGFDFDFSPTVTLQEDQRRRDLTINQLAVDVNDWEKFKETANEQLIIDSYNGIQDLKNGILRHVSSYFAEDPLRVFRVARFAARFDFIVHPDTLELMKRLVNSGEMQTISTERIWLELNKANSTRYPFNFYQIIIKCNALNTHFDEQAITSMRAGAAILQSFNEFDRKNIVNNKLTDTDVNNLIVFGTLRPDKIIEGLSKLKGAEQIIKLLGKNVVLFDWILNENRQSTDLLRLMKTFNVRQDPTLLLDIMNLWAAVYNYDQTLIDILNTAIPIYTTTSYNDIDEVEQRVLKGKDIQRKIDSIVIDRLNKEVYDQ